MGEIVLLWAQPAAVVVAAIGVGWAVRSHQKQLEAQMFLTLTSRYDEIMRSFPDDAFACRFASDHTMPQPSDELTLAVLRYLNLCSEEFYLWKTGYLPDRVWRIWSTELERMFLTPLFLREWPKLTEEFVSFSEFRALVSSVQHAQKRSHTISYASSQAFCLI